MFCAGRRNGCSVSAKNASPETFSASVQPLRSGGAAAFYEQHAQASFIEACYSVAPPRIQAALAEEIDYLRQTLSGVGRALELGCGNGRLLEALAAVPRRWVGVDFLESYLRDAQARCRLAPATALVAANALTLPFADAAFDAVLCAQSTLGLLGKGKLTALHEARRVLRPGGRVLAVVYSELSVVPRAEWYTEMHRRGAMAPLDWARSGPDLLITADGHASECFTRQRLEQLFAQAGLAPRLERLGEIYWTVEAQTE